MASAARAAAEGRHRIVDLFSGWGALSLGLADTARLHAVDIDGPALDALRKASHGRPGITVEGRDLIREPLPAARLAEADLVIFDPPRAGAREQVREIVSARIDKVVAVSCDPGTFARDLRILVDGGYQVERLEPIDQFPWTAHLEVLAILSLPGAKPA